MKIIREGRIPEDFVVRINCLHCHTVFEFSLKEANYQHDQRDGDFYSIACPLCKTDCTMSTSMVQDQRDTASAASYYDK
jgi:hypothetical protein